MKKKVSFSQVSIQSIAVMISAGLTLSACGSELLTEARSEQGPGSQVVGEVPEANESNSGDEEPAAEIAEEIEATADTNVITAESAPTPSPSPTETVVAETNPEATVSTELDIPRAKLNNMGNGIHVRGKEINFRFKVYPMIDNATLERFPQFRLEIQNLDHPCEKLNLVKTLTGGYGFSAQWPTENYSNGRYRVILRFQTADGRLTKVVSENEIVLRNYEISTSKNMFGTFDENVQTETVLSPRLIIQLKLNSGTAHLSGLRAFTTFEYTETPRATAMTHGMIPEAGSWRYPLRTACPDGYAVSGVVIHHSEPRGAATGMNLQCSNINNPFERIKLEPVLVGASNYQTEVTCDDHLYAVGLITSFERDGLRGFALHCQ
jgi:hypothetical protein